MGPIPVLMYHHVSPHEGDTVTVRPEVFAGQMRHIAAAGYRTLTLKELIDYVEGRFHPAEKCVVVTFDDGWLDNYLYAWPVMKQHGIKSTVFLVTDRTEQASASFSGLPGSIPDHNGSKALIAGGEAGKVVMTWDVVRELAATGLVEFHSHTLSHRKCNQLDNAELRREITDSKRVMEKRLGKECPYLCWPYGKYDDRGVRFACEAGYQALFTTRPGVVRPGSDLLHLERIVVKDGVGWLKMRLLIYTNSWLSKLYLGRKRR